MKISVVTVCYHVVQEIEKTILSVLGQTYPDIEYIVIDGGSMDGTLDVIKKYEDKISYYVSEPDGGIYDAMNKGIKVATGEWINFLNAGDCFYNSRSVEDVFSNNISSEVDVVYGYQVHSYTYGKYIRKQLPLSSFYKGMPFGHESSFVRASVMKRIGFDVNYRIAADYHFFFNLYASGSKFQPVDAIVTDFESMNGISSSMRTALLAFREFSMVNGNIETTQYKKGVLSLYIRNSIKRFISLFSKDIVMEQQRKQRERNEEFIPLERFVL